MQAIDTKSSASAFPLSYLMSRHARFPEGMKIERSVLGKGSNNKALEATYNGASVVLRAPRRRSDTQQRTSALWEFRQTLKAAQLGVSPKLIDACYARHAQGPWTSGLYLVMERFDTDLDEAIRSQASLRSQLLAEDGLLMQRVSEQIVSGLAKLASVNFLVFDLKPSNVVLRVKDGGAEARIVDFGKDFCEWHTKEDDPDARTPVITGLQCAIARTTSHNTGALLKHILFSVMLVQLASVNTFQLHEDRHRHRLSASERRVLNKFAVFARTLIDSMRASHVGLLRRTLRTDEVRGVLQHYLGRRNAGTRRVLRYAQEAL